MRWMILALLAAASLSLIAFADDTPPTAPASPQAVEAKKTHDLAIKEAKEAYHKALIAADEQYVADLDAALKAAMQNQDIDLARALDDQKKAAIAVLKGHQSDFDAYEQTPSDHDKALLYLLEADAQDAVGQNHRVQSRGDAFYFDGNAWIDLPDMPAVTNELTVFFWGNLQTDKQPDPSRVTDCFAFNSRVWQNDGGEVYCGWRPGEGVVVDVSGARPLGESDVALLFRTDASAVQSKWVAYAFTVDVQKRTVKLYLNGTLVKSRDFDNLPRLAIKPAIGGHFSMTCPTPNRSWQGLLRGVRIYNRVLSDDEIKELSR